MIVAPCLNNMVKLITMKKIFFLIAFLLMISLWLNSQPVRNTSLPKSSNRFAGSNWKFKNVVSEDPSVAHYLNTLYGGTEYRFASKTFTGKLFELPISGTWEASANMLVLNKGTNKEETYQFTLPSPNNLILQTTERGKKVFISFARQ